jgi:transcriptional regulator with XRE-family HTH domain
MAAPWGEAIRRLREAKDLTRKQVAKTARMSPTTYSSIERGKHTQTRNLEKIAAALQVDLAEVLVPPRVSLALEERRELAKEIAVDVLRVLDTRDRRLEDDAAGKKGSREKPEMVG